MDLRKLIAENLQINGRTAEEIAAMLETPKDAKMGDLCLPCFRLSKEFSKAPMVIAGELCESFSAPNITASVAGGYLNFSFNAGFLTTTVVSEVLARGSSFSPAPQNGKTVVLDYSSINIAKPFHIGHLLTTVIGGSLKKIFDFLGYKTVGINHLGDWGTQFGKLIYAYLNWSSDEQLTSGGIDVLLELYVRFHKEAELDKSLEDEARAWFKRLEDGDKTAVSLLARFKEITLKEVNAVYKRLGVSFDSYDGESFFNDKMQPVVDRLNELGLLEESDGAKVVRLEDEGMPPCLILRSDGATLYATRDLAAAWYRKNTYDFDKCLYVVAYQQNLHFRQIFKVLEKMDFEWAQDLEHVAFGMVSLEGGSMSTREGRVVFLKDVLQTAVTKAKEIINAKNPDLKDKDDIAEKVGVGSVIFMALYNGRIKDMVFSYDKALNFEGETAPYLMYTHARCCSLINKAGDFDIKKAEILKDERSKELVLLLNRFDDTVVESANRYEPSIVTRYLIDLAQSFNRFYLENRILNAEDGVREARLALTLCVRNVLKNGMKLILLDAPEAM